MYDFVFVLLIMGACTVEVFASSVSDAFKENGFVPKWVPVAPEGYAMVKYAEFEADLGNNATRDQVRDPPNVTYDNSPDEFYTVLMLGPDTFSDRHPWFSNFLFWLVVNIPGDDTLAGDTRSEYFKPNPEPFTGPHRHIFLVYRQPNKTDFDEPHVSSLNPLPRIFFSPAELSEKYGFGDPVAGNFFQIQTFGDQLL